MRHPAAGCPETQEVEEVGGPSVELNRWARRTASASRRPLPPAGVRGTPWSQWGQGVVLPDGRFVSAIGDEGTTDANSFVFEYDPATGQLTRTADVLSIAGHHDGDFGYGKIHAQVRLDPCGTVWATTYWGSQSSSTTAAATRAIC